MDEQTYTCAMCGGVFESDWSDEDALAEKDALWGDTPVDECDVVCDDCWQILRPLGVLAA